MEVINPMDVVDLGREVDELAERVFMESIRIAGGLKQVIEFRNLTWVPSLAAASYAVVLKEEFMFTKSRIAEYLGITEQTVENILRAKEEEVEMYIKGELEKVDEHKAGGLAKLAHKRLKEEGRLRALEIPTTDLKEMEEILSITWPVLVLHAIKGVRFPVKGEVIRERLKKANLRIEGKDLSSFIGEEEFKKPNEVLKAIKNGLSKTS